MCNIIYSKMLYDINNILLCYIQSSYTPSPYSMRVVLRKVVAISNHSNSENEYSGIQISACLFFFM